MKSRVCRVLLGVVFFGAAALIIHFAAVLQLIHGNTSAESVGEWARWPPRKLEMDRIADRENRLTVVGVSSDYMDTFDLWYRHAVNESGIQNFVIVSLDEPSYQLLHARFPERTLLPSFVNGSVLRHAKYGNQEFTAIVSSRPEFISTFLKMGYDVFYIDIDTIIVRNPFPLFAELVHKENADFLIADDSHGLRSDTENMCTGIFFARSCQNCIELMHRWRDTIAKNGVIDQTAFNHIFLDLKSENSSLRLLVLDKLRFPNGYIILNGQYNWTINPEGPFVVHANYIAGHDIKMHYLTKVLPAFIL